MIPKTIHYCWFGGKPKPKLAKKCIKSWKKYLPDYQTVEWNEDTFDISASPLYVQQAYEAKKWAFVTDYVRLWAMYHHGGIYMDTDVEVVKPLDKFLQDQAFSGFESKTNIQTGIMACEKHFPLFGELLREYDDISFILEDGSYNLTTNVERITRACHKYGFVPNGQKQIIEGLIIYPKDYFCPLDVLRRMERTGNTHTIHWFSGSWLPEGTKEKIEKWRKDDKISRFRYAPNRFLRKVMGDERYERIKAILGKK